MRISDWSSDVCSSDLPIEAAGQIKPESINHYEAGIKTQFWDGKATLNLSAFRTDIRDFQATVTNGQFGVLRGFLANAEKVRSQGIEADFSEIGRASCREGVCQYW